MGRSKKNSKRLGIGWNGKPTIRNAKGFREWNRAAIAAIHAAAEPYLFSHAREVGVHITFNVSDRRKWDLTNWAESVMDALVEAGALADDDRFTVSQVSLKWLPCLPNQGREGISVTLSGLVSLPMTS